MRALLFASLLLLPAGCGRAGRFVAYRLSGSAPEAACASDARARWCVFSPRGARSEDLVYFFHYATGDELSWDRIWLSRAFYARYRDKGLPAPRVVAVSYGTHWLLSSRPGIAQTVALSDFDALRADIERGLGPVRRRYAWGMSQGGYNAALLALSRPRDWAAAALSCPALLPASPYERPAREPFSRSAEGRDLFLHRLAGGAHWVADDPVGRAASATSPPPPFWIEANRSDEFGFYAGAEALAAALRRAGGGVELRPAAGGHCYIDARAAADFLAAQAAGDHGAP